jgi:DNA-directed RNA polymerase subunit L
MDPVIEEIKIDAGYLTFTLKGVDVSVANAIRRIIMSEIETVVFRTAPYSKSLAKIKTNTTRLNNEIIKQRLSCIPIYGISVENLKTSKYYLKINKTNTSSKVEYVTTEDFQITKDIDTELSRKELDAIFPTNAITKSFIDLVRLRPKIGNVEGDSLILTCELDVGSAQEDSSFNVASTCSYTNTPDQIKANIAWEVEKRKYPDLPKNELAFIKRDWDLLDSKRHFTPKSFDFKVQSVGQYTNKELVEKSCEVMIKKLGDFQKNLAEKTQSKVNIVPADTTIPNAFDIVMYGEGYTLGKVIEWLVFHTYYEDGAITYCGFVKPHPHDDMSKIRIGLNETLEGISTVYEMLNEVVAEALKIFTVILSHFTPSHI